QVRNGIGSVTASTYSCDARVDVSSIELLGSIPTLRSASRTLVIVHGITACAARLSGNGSKAASVMVKRWNASQPPSTELIGTKTVYTGSSPPNRHQIFGPLNAQRAP